MAVNENDRVSTRRLKQFWDLLTIGTEKIKDFAVTSSKLADNSVTYTKLANNSVSADKLTSLAVTETKIGQAAVTEAKIANSSISENKLQSNSVSTSKIKNGAVDENKLNDDVKAKLNHKPNYNMPNTNDQIGVGYGYNYTEDYIAATPHDFGSSLPSFLSWLRYATGDLSSTSSGTSAKSLYNNVSRAVDYVISLASDNPAKRTEIKRYFAAMEGSLSIIPAIIYNEKHTEDPSDAWITEDMLHSTFDVTGLLTSPVYNHDGHTYQTQFGLLQSSSTSLNVSYKISIDGGAFEDSLMNGDCIISCITMNNPLYAYGLGYLPNESVKAEKLSASLKNWIVRSYRNNVNADMAYSGKSSYIIYSFNIDGDCSTIFSADDTYESNKITYGVIDNKPYILIKTGVLGIETSINFITSSGTPKRIGFATIVSDNGYYFTPVIVSKYKNNGNYPANSSFTGKSLQCQLLDPTFITHRTETNAHIYIMMPIQQLPTMSDSLT